MGDTQKPSNSIHENYVTSSFAIYANIYTED